MLLLEVLLKLLSDVKGHLMTQQVNALLLFLELLVKTHILESPKEEQLDLGQQAAYLLGFIYFHDYFGDAFQIFFAQHVF